MKKSIFIFLILFFLSTIFINAENEWEIRTYILKKILDEQGQTFYTDNNLII